MDGENDGKFIKMDDLGVPPFSETKFGMSGSGEQKWYKGKLHLRNIDGWICPLNYVPAMWCEARFDGATPSCHIFSMQSGTVGDTSDTWPGKVGFTRRSLGGISSLLLVKVSKGTLKFWEILHVAPMWYIYVYIDVPVLICSLFLNIDILIWCIEMYWFRHVYLSYVASCVLFWILN